MRLCVSLSLYLSICLSVCCRTVEWMPSNEIPFLCKSFGCKCVRRCSCSIMVAILLLFFAHIYNHSVKRSAPNACERYADRTGNETKLQWKRDKPCVSVCARDIWKWKTNIAIWSRKIARPTKWITNTKIPPRTGWLYVVKWNMPITIKTTHYTASIKCSVLDGKPRGNETERTKDEFRRKKKQLYLYNAFFFAKSYRPKRIHRERSSIEPMHGYSV